MIVIDRGKVKVDDLLFPIFSSGEAVDLGEVVGEEAVSVRRLMDEDSEDAPIGLVPFAKKSSEDGKLIFERETCTGHRSTPVFGSFSNANI